MDGKWDVSIVFADNGTKTTTYIYTDANGKRTISKQVVFLHSDLIYSLEVPDGLETMRAAIRSQGQYKQGRA